MPVCDLQESVRNVFERLQTRLLGERRPGTGALQNDRQDCQRKGAWSLNMQCFFEIVGGCHAILFSLCAKHTQLLFLLLLLLFFVCLFYGAAYRGCDGVSRVRQKDEGSFGRE